MDQSDLKGCQVLGLRYDLLGAKLNSFVNAIRIGQTYDLSPRAFWALTGPGARGRWARDLGRPDELFSANFISKYLLTNPPIMADMENKLVYAQKKGPFKVVEELNDVIVDNRIIVVQERMEVISFPWENPSQCRTDFASSFNDIVDLSGQACREIDRFHSTLSRFPSRPVGIHVRRGDIIRHPVTMRGAWRGMYQPDEVIFKTIERLAEEGKKAVLFCNDGEFVNKASNLFNSVIISNDQVDQEVETNILIDFMDIYKMSACDYIIGSGVSAFSAVARNIGNLNLIKFEQAISKVDFSTACENSRARAFEDQGSFLCEGDILQTINFLLGYYIDKDDAVSFKNLIAEARSRDLDISSYIDSFTKHKNFESVMDGTKLS